MRPRAVFDAVLRIVQADGSAAAGDHHVVQRGRIERSASRGIAALAQGPDYNGCSRIAVAQRHHAGLAEQHVDDGGRGLLVDLADREVETSEGLVAEFEADAAVHRGQRRLSRPGRGSPVTTRSPPAVSSQTARHRGPMIAA